MSLHILYGYNFLYLFSTQGRISDISATELGTDIDDHSSPIASGYTRYTSLAPVHEEVSYACMILCI